MDDALAGIRVLVVGADRDAAEELRRRLTAAGSASVDLVPVVESVAAHAAAARPQVVLTLADVDAEAVRARIDPLGLDGSPAVVAHAELAPDGDPLGPAAVRRLRLVAEHREMRARLSDLESLVAGDAVRGRREHEEAAVDTMRRLALAAEYGDDNSPEHTHRVAALAARMARHLGEPDRLVWMVRQAAPLHDLGKIAVPDALLLKPGRLDEQEIEVVRTHTVLGARVLADGGAEVLDVAERIARSHHERWDGEGYPEGLAGPDIPLVARLVHVADVFDVLVHERPYKQAWTVEAAAGAIRDGAGTEFDPAVVSAFDALAAGGWTADLGP